MNKQKGIEEIEKTIPLEGISGFGGVIDDTV